MDPYQVLGVGRDASADQIKAAYRELAKKWHPDRSKEAGATERFQQISAAYDTLSNPAKRREYDLTGGLGGGLGGGGFGGNMHHQMSAEDAQQLFAQMFPGGAGVADLFHMVGRGFQPQTKVIRFEATLEQLAARETRKWRIRRTRHDRNNESETRNVSIKLSPDWDDGYSIRIADGGDVDAQGNAEPIEFVMRIAAHPRFRRRPRSAILECTLRVTLAEALCGYSTTMRDVTGDTFTVESELIDPQKPVVVRRRGMPRESGGRGDLYIRFQVDYPKRGLPAETRARLRELLA